MSVYAGNLDDLESGTTTAVYIAVSEQTLEAVTSDDTSVQEALDDESVIILEIKPYQTITTQSTNTSETTLIENDQLQSPITFKIYLNDTFEGDAASVIHIKENGTVQTYTCQVQTDSDGKYFQLTVTEFSQFIVTPVISTLSSGTENSQGSTSTDDSTNTTSSGTYYVVEDTSIEQAQVALVTAAQSTVVAATKVDSDNTSDDETTGETAEDEFAQGEFAEEEAVEDPDEVQHEEETQVLPQTEDAVQSNGARFVVVIALTLLVAVGIAVFIVKKRREEESD